MTQQTINDRAAAARETYRAPDGKFGAQPAAESTDLTLGGTVAEDLAGVSDQGQAQDHCGEVIRLVAARETLTQNLRRTFPDAQTVTVKHGQVGGAPYLHGATTSGGGTTDLTDPRNYPGDGTWEQYDDAVLNGVSSWDAGAVDEVYGPAVGGVRTLDLRVDWDGDPDGEDQYDPDTQGYPVDEHHERVVAAFNRLADVAGGLRTTTQDEMSRLHHAREALTGLFRTSHPGVSRIQIGEEMEGPYVETAYDRDGNQVDVTSGWPPDLDIDEVSYQLRSTMSSPSEVALERKFPYGPGGYSVAVVDRSRPPRPGEVTEVATSQLRPGDAIFVPDDPAGYRSRPGQDAPGRTATVYFTRNGRVKASFDDDGGAEAFVIDDPANDQSHLLRIR